MANKLNEGSEFTIPLKNLIGLIAFTGIAVWGYFGIIERLAFLEHDKFECSSHVDERSGAFLCPVNQRLKLVECAAARVIPL